MEQPRRYNVLYVEENQDGTVGGSYFSLYTMIRGLDRRRFTPYALFYNDHRLLEDFRTVCHEVIVLPPPRRYVPGKRLERAADGRPPRALAKVPARVLTMASNLIRLRAVPTVRYYRLIKKRKIDLVHLNNAVWVNHEWMLAARWAGIRCVSHQRGIADSPVPRATYLYVNCLDAVICVSAAVQRFLEQRRLTGKRSCVVYNAVDTRAFLSKACADPVRREFGIQGRWPVVGVVGNIRRWKGQGTVVRAIHSLRQDFPDILCLVVGEPSAEQRDRVYLEELKSFIEEHGLERHVTFAGYRKDVASCIRAMDVLVHSSIEPEPFGRVILEGMALEKPVIATHIGGPCEIIQDQENGILVSPGSHEELSRAIRLLLEDEEKAKRIALNGRKTVLEKFSPERQVRDIMEIYEQVLGIAPGGVGALEAPLLKRIAEAINGTRADEAATKLAVEPGTGTGWTSDGFVLTHEAGGRARQLYLKRYKREAGDDAFLRKCLENEYRGLGYAHAVFAGSEHFHAPGAVAVLASDRSILMEFVRGTSLLEATARELGRTGFRSLSRDLLDRFRMAGRLLKRFQKGVEGSHERSAGEDVYGEIFSSARQAIQDLVRLGVSEKIHAAYLEHLKRLEDTTPAPPRQVRLPVHWDFRPHNILLEQGAGRLVLIDFQLFAPAGNPYRDPATFLLSILVECGSLLVRTKPLSELMSHFLSGYLEQGEPFHGFSTGMLDGIMQARLPWHLRHHLRRRSGLAAGSLRRLAAARVERRLAGVLQGASLLGDCWR
ncbi:MAG: glycosyltransferase [bacterium]